MTGQDRLLRDRARMWVPALVMMGGIAWVGLGGCALEQEKKQQSQFDNAVHERIVHYLVQEDETPLRREGLTEKQAHGAMWAMFNQGGSRCALIARKLMADAVIAELSPDYQSVENVAGMRESMEREHLCDEDRMH